MKQAGAGRYTEDFFRMFQKGSSQSARAVIPLVLELVQPRSVIDVGCGIGAWLAAFGEYGVEDVVGLDGDYVNRDMLQIPKERFFAFDLTKPFRLNRQFDLVMSLEVAEHLPKESANGFVDSLTRLGPVVLFSAAIPFQEGAHHINEQWPEYWANIFREKRFAVVDCVRRRIWNNDAIEWWYAQNMLLFVRSDYLETHEALKRESRDAAGSPLAIVHPRWYLEKEKRLAKATDPRLMSLGKTLRALPRILLYKVTGKKGRPSFYDSFIFKT